MSSSGSNGTGGDRWADVHDCSIHGEDPDPTCPICNGNSGIGHLQHDAGRYVCGPPHNSQLLDAQQGDDEASTGDLFGSPQELSSSWDESDEPEIADAAPAPVTDPTEVALALAELSCNAARSTVADVDSMLASESPSFEALLSITCRDAPCPLQCAGSLSARFWNCLSLAHSLFTNMFVALRLIVNSPENLVAKRDKRPNRRNRISFKRKGLCVEILGVDLEHWPHFWACSAILLYLLLNVVLLHCAQQLPAVYESSDGEYDGRRRLGSDDNRLMLKSIVDRTAGFELPDARERKCRRSFARGDGPHGMHSQLHADSLDRLCSSRSLHEVQESGLCFPAVSPGFLSDSLVMFDKSNWSLLSLLHSKGHDGVHRSYPVGKSYMEEHFSGERPFSESAQQQEWDIQRLNSVYGRHADASCRQYLPIFALAHESGKPEQLMEAHTLMAACTKATNPSEAEHQMVQASQLYESLRPNSSDAPVDGSHVVPLISFLFASAMHSWPALPLVEGNLSAALALSIAHDLHQTYVSAHLHLAVLKAHENDGKLATLHLHRAESLLITPRDHVLFLLYLAKVARLTPSSSSLARAAASNAEMFSGRHGFTDEEMTAREMLAMMQVKSLFGMDLEVISLIVQVCVALGSSLVLLRIAWRSVSGSRDGDREAVVAGSQVAAKAFVIAAPESLCKITQSAL